MMFLIFLFYIDWILFKESEASNICDYYEKRDPLCCPGWMKNVYGDCVKSECDQDCGFGKCVGLNVCECYDKSVRSEACPQIYQKFCINNCSNKGRCLNGKCICESGFSGEDCNTTIVSTCYVKINRGLCKSTPENLQLSKKQCCEIFKVAWGNPCEFCNKESVCPKGYMPRNGECEDIDECQFRGICLNGHCVNEKGSFRCRCPPDYHLDESTMSCQYQRDPCLIYASQCGFYGRCTTKPDGQYKCICRKPYEPSANEKSCVKNSFYNVCKSSNKLCLPHGECQPSGMSYFCNCLPGFHQSGDRKSCLVNSNGDLCKNPEVVERCRGGLCISEPNGYRCECYGDYRTSNNEQECIRQITNGPVYRSMCSKWEYYSLCRSGECVDTDNDYYCKCTNGFKMADKGRKCEKIEIKEPVTEEPDNPYCQLSEYSSRCRGGQCIADRHYGFKCICLPGFTASRDSRTCEQNSIDVCLTYGHLCKPGRCRKSGHNDYQCECPQYTMMSEDGKSCLKNYITTVAPPGYCDVQRHRERCATGDCIPDPDYGFRCICRPDYKTSEDGRACYKMETVLSLCSRYQVQCQGGGCMELDEYNYECQCLKDFTRSADGRSCFRSTNRKKPKDICASNGHKCKYGRCQSVGYNDYQCICPQYTIKSQDGKSCSINYKTTMAALGYCDMPKNRERCATGDCIPDSDYGFRCICRPDHKTSEDGRACYKIEEMTNPKCAQNQHRCRGGYCFDVDNGYLCICNDNFVTSIDGRECLLNEKISLKFYSANGVATVNEDRIDHCKFKENVEKCQPGNCVETLNGYRCVCPHSFKVNENEHECNRDASKCPYCHYGCTDSKNISKCSCPDKYEDLYDTGLCIVKKDSIKHSLGNSTCNSDSANKTTVIRFNGITKGSTENSVELDNKVSELLLEKQRKPIRLSFCVPIRKRNKPQKRVQRQVSTDVFSWQIVCIFDC